MIIFNSDKRIYLTSLKKACIGLLIIASLLFIASLFIASIRTYFGLFGLIAPLAIILLLSRRVVQIEIDTENDRITSHYKFTWSKVKKRSIYLSKTRIMIERASNEKRISRLGFLHKKWEAFAISGEDGFSPEVLQSVVEAARDQGNTYYRGRFIFKIDSL